MNVRQMYQGQKVRRKDLLADPYDPREIVTTASDDKGHYVNLRLKVPSAVASQAAVFVNDDDYPEIRTPQDAYRDAIFWRFRWHSEHPRNGAISTAWRPIEYMIRAQSIIERQQLIQEMALKMLEQIDTIGSQAQASGTVGEANRLLEQLGDEMPVDTFPEETARKILTRISFWLAQLNT